ncbi:hypothetical protein MFIFM68171_06256 [Madurella fahalii]|uniref:Uncharacterized protein n=1 Tax=Madurella fahalii TaxID=1157608 RepID=A0ABQ0GE70_9PEZI
MDDEWLTGKQRELRKLTVSFWHSNITNESRNAERGIIEGIRPHIEMWSRRTAAFTSKVIAAEPDEELAEAVRLAIPDQRDLLRSLFLSVIAQLQREYGIPILPTPTANAPEISTDTDTIDVEPNRPDHTTDGLNVDITDGGIDNSNKRPSHVEPDVTPSAKRARLDLGNQEVYDLSSDAEDTQGLTDIRTIESQEVEGNDFIFEYRAAGPGWFVVRCDGDFVTSNIMHNFDAHPFFRNRAKKHFLQKKARERCHAEDVQGDYSHEEIMRKFGYRVVDSEGNNVTKEWVKASNERLAITKEKGKAKSKPKSKPKADNKGKDKGKDEVQTAPGPLSTADMYGGPARRSNTYASHISAQAGPSRTEPRDGAASGSASTTAQVPTAEMDDPFADDDDLLPVVSDVLTTAEAPEYWAGIRARRGGA